MYAALTIMHRRPVSPSPRGCREAAVLRPQKECRVDGASKAGDTVSGPKTDSLTENKVVPRQTLGEFLNQSWRAYR